MYFVIIIAFMILSFAVSQRLKNKFRKYSQIGISSGLSGAEIAHKMLKDNRIFDVQVISTPGELTDHYNPANKTVNLSEGVYQGRSAAAAAVAAHECGHAIQHATAYSWLELRSKLVPLQAVSGKIINIIVFASIFGGAFLFQTFPYDYVLLAIIGAYAIITSFSLVTLPVEFDASRRALQWISSTGVTSSLEHGMAKDALKWAAMTYVVAALSSLVTLLYYLSIFLGNRD
ncbi:MAG: zinc metallopeptidase [Cyclobacteriaceae bacterium]